MSPAWQVLVPEQIDPAGPAALADVARCTSMAEYDTVADALTDLPRYDGVIVRTAELDAEVIERADRLRVIAKHGTGLDNVDIKAASRNDVLVCNTPGENAQSVAEHAIALLLAVRRNLLEADRHVRDGTWERGTLAGRELNGDTLGLLGYGSIATRVGTIARGFGLAIITYDPHHAAEAMPADVERVEDLHTLFSTADAVSLHAPLTDETHHAVGHTELEALGEDGVLINTARGGIVDERALIDALEEGLIAGAGLDTFEREPPTVENTLLERDDVVVTPHIGGVTDQALERMSLAAARNVRIVAEGGIPDSTVNRAAIKGEVA